MNRDSGTRGREHAVDWLEVAVDLPHLFARLSELVHGAGYAPGDLVLIPRSELDRRETASFTAGWAEAMGEDLPRLRREYEKRVAEAYAAGTAGRRGEPKGAGQGRGQGRGQGQGPGQGADVIRLPVTALIESPAPVREAEERMRRAHAILDRRSEADAGTATGPDTADDLDGTAHAHAAEPDATAGEPRAHEEPAAPAASAEPVEPAGPVEPAEPEPEPDATAAALLPAQQIREKRTPPASRKVARRNGRPIVPPLDSVPVQPRAQGPAADSQATAGAGRRSLAARARALADEMDSKSGGGRPVPPEGGR